MKNRLKVCIVLILSSVLVACSANSSDTRSEMSRDGSNHTSIEMDSTSESMMNMDADYAAMDNQMQQEEQVSVDDFTETERRIIHHAYMDVSVKGVEKSQTSLENKVKEISGYIVESKLYHYEQEQKQVTIIARIPEQSFQSFMEYIEDNAVKVLERNVSSEDVTGEYVDLESRLKSKKAVEKRLLAFMEDAKKTEDLLHISNELANVQEEIEVLTGQMKYIENQSAYATVEITLQENNISVPTIGDTELNTWEKVKKQLASSMNGILFVGSSLIVFIVGNIPVLLLIVLITFPIYLIIRRKRRK